MPVELQCLKAVNTDLLKYYNGANASPKNANLILAFYFMVNQCLLPTM